MDVCEREGSSRILLRFSVVMVFCFEDVPVKDKDDQLGDQNLLCLCIDIKRITTVFLYINKCTDHNSSHRSQCYKIAILMMKLRHIIEIHPINPAMKVMGKKVKQNKWPTPSSPVGFWSESAREHGNKVGNLNV